jgi:methylphosphotriester-DNA--protein-cysteine methyltransferase
VAADGRPYESSVPGTIGGHRRTRIYGRIDCPSALRAVAKGGYVANRVFFVAESDAIAAGYRPCAVCMPAAYLSWIANEKGGAPSAPSIRNL